MKDLIVKAANIKLLALDVDGILSDGKIIYDSNGVETKEFYVQDGVGIKSLLDNGINVAIITGRNSPMVSKRASELGIKYIIQGRDDKVIALTELVEQLNISLKESAYMGDDLPDIRALMASGFSVTVPNAHIEVLNKVDMVTAKSGGNGAVREVTDILLKAIGKYDAFIKPYVTE